MLSSKPILPDSIKSWINHAVPVIDNRIKVPDLAPSMFMCIVSRGRAHFHIHRLLNNQFKKKINDT